MSGAKVGGVTVLSVAPTLALVHFFNWGAGGKAIADWVAARTGLDCPRRAKDAGYEEGTTEYTEYVEECQDDAQMGMTAITIGIIAVVGVVAYSLVKK